MRALGLEPERYMGMSLFIAILSAISLLLAMLLLGVELALPFTLLGSAAILTFLIMLPGLELRGRAAETEADLPFFLRSLGMLLEMGLPFAKALDIAAEGKGQLGKEMRKLVQAMDEGMGMQKAFSSFARNQPSLSVKRAVSQMISSYEIGSSGKEMKEIGDELLYMEQHRLKQHAAKSAMFGLVFIITSAVFPTFFLVYAIMGRYAFSTELSEAQVMLAMLIVFPSLSALALMLSKASMPKAAFSEKGSFDARLIIPGFVFMAGSFIPGLQLVALLTGSGIAIYLIFSSYRDEKRVEEIEAMLPDALFSVSGMPKSTKPERIFDTLQRGGFGALSEEAAKSRRQLSMNLRTEAVLDDLWQRNGSGMLRKACVMMKQMMLTNSLDRMGMLAEDMIRHFQMRRERSQIFAMQKYTLMFGALLVPLIMNSALSLLGSMGDLLKDSSVADASAFSSSIVPPYLILYAIIASSAIADAEGKRSSAALYFMVLAGAGILTFEFIKL
jgi:Flp pilus assembly protein TadB